MRASLIVAVGCALALVGCAAKGPATVTFEAAGFIKAYMADRDAVIRQTAPMYAKCHALPDTATADARRACEAFTTTMTDWYARDAIVYNAMIAGKPITTVDWDQVIGVAAKLMGLAATVGVLVP